MFTLTSVHFLSDKLKLDLLIKNLPFFYSSVKKKSSPRMCEGIFRVLLFAELRKKRRRVLVFFFFVSNLGVGGTPRRLLISYKIKRYCQNEKGK